MCGIIGGISSRDIKNILLEGLFQLEYRGYDSSGMALIKNSEITIHKSVGKVSLLQEIIDKDQNFKGKIGIAHTRWATHGKPSITNCHPHISNNNIVLVHNGIIENYLPIKEKLKALHYDFRSETDSEVIAHLLHYNSLQYNTFFEAFQDTISELTGAFALSIYNTQDQDKLYIARKGSPLVIGCGFNEHFIASDQLSLLPITNKFIFLEENDIGYITENDIYLSNKGKEIKREIHHNQQNPEIVDKGQYKHFMLKEIFEQPSVLSNNIKESQFIYDRSIHLDTLLAKIENIHIIACGTSYHAGSVAKYWIENYLDIGCSVDIASEYRYRNIYCPPNTLFLSLSQSGETADTLAALKKAKNNDNYLSFACICNNKNASLVRLSEITLPMEIGPEIGVASTKAFTGQLCSLLKLIYQINQNKKRKAEVEQKICNAFEILPIYIEKILSIQEKIKTLATELASYQQILFLGRGEFYPIALEGALKLKEISYINAIAYAAGELKHGPIALIDEHLPSVILVPNNHLLNKLKSNIEEIQARNGKVFIITNKAISHEFNTATSVITLPFHFKYDDFLEPILFTIPLQLLAYYVALHKGTDIDKPRNLAKSVTVE